MSKNAAFRFIPELIGDYVHVMELAENPPLMFIESALETIHMASELYGTVSAFKNTKNLKDLESSLSNEYNNQKEQRAANYETEMIDKLNNEYQMIRLEIKRGKFQNEAVQGFMMRLKDNLHRVLEEYEALSLDQSFAERSRIEEVTRRAFRDYNNIVSLHLEEVN